MASEAERLYPHHRKAKQEPKELSSSTTLAFTSTLSSLLSQPTSKIASGRPRPSKSKDDIFAGHNRNTKSRAARDLDPDAPRGRPGWDKRGIGAVDDNALFRSKRKMEEKAKVYKRMKRGDYVSKEGEEESMIDFDRKWAETHGSESSEDEEDPASKEIVEFEDEYGRTKTGTRAEKDRMERRKRNQLLGAEELDRMTARPAMPARLIYGDTVQSMAFNPDEETGQKMEELARKRDRSLTPPEMKHYEADKEFRIKGVGFYSFSKDEKLRAQEMENLEKERLETERLRREREEKKEARKKEIEERRRVLGEKRAKKQADSFLDSLGADLGATEQKESE